MTTRRNILVVDDDPSMLGVIRRLLRAAGFVPALFDSVASFQKDADLEQAACVVLDINLNGQSGLDVRRSIAAEDASLPVIFMTGNDSERVREAAMQTGCVAYLVKPFPARMLLDAVAVASAERERTS